MSTLATVLLAAWLSPAALFIAVVACSTPPPPDLGYDIIARDLERLWELPAFEVGTEAHRHEC